MPRRTGRLRMGRFGLLAVLTLLAFGTAQAQTPLGVGNAFDPPIRLEADETPLGEVLRALAVQARIDIVFAERVVAGRTVSGRYIGSDPEGALATVLRGSGLRAERVRETQYVIVPISPDLPPVNGPPVTRGILDGTVIDAETGEVLPGAHVVLAGLGLGTVTNAAGHFALVGLPTGSYRVRVSYVGYRTAELDLPVYGNAAVARPVVRLMPQPITSAGTVVEGQEGQRQDLELVPGTSVVSVRHAAAVPAALGEADLFEALTWLPGVARAVEAGGELVVRGAEAQYNRYLLDGAPVLMPWHAFGLFSTFQPELFKGIRLHRGSLPAEYGSGLSAVIDLDVRDGERGTVSGTVGLSPVAARAVVEAPLGRGVSMMVAARQSWVDQLLEPRLRFSPSSGLPALRFGLGALENGVPDAGQDTGFGFRDGAAKLTWRIADGHRLSLTLFEAGDHLSTDAPTSALGGWGRFAALPATDSLRLALDTRRGNRVVSARYRGLMSRTVFLTATAYSSQYRSDERVGVAEPSGLLADTDYRLRITESGVRLDADYYHSLEHQLRGGIRVLVRDFGANLLENQRTPEGSAPRRERRETIQALELSVYAQDTWRPFDGVQVQPGVRAELFALGGYLTVDPRLHLRYRLLRHGPAERLVLRAGVSRQTQALHRLRTPLLETERLATDRWIPADEQVRPASAWQAATGIEWHPRHDVTLGVEAFGRALSDILLPNEPGRLREPAASLDAGPPPGYIAGTGRAVGLEALAEHERGRWRLGLAYSLSRTEERVPGFGYRAARYDAPHQVNASVVGAGRWWTFAAGATWRSGYPVRRLVVEFASDGTPTASGTQQERPPTAFRFDAALGTAFHFGGLNLEAQLQAYGLLARRNGFSDADLADPFAEVPELPAVPMLALRARW